MDRSAPPPTSPTSGADAAEPRAGKAFAAWLLAAWLCAGVASGIRLHQRGGVFGEAVPLADSVVASLLNALPWLAAAGVAWVMAGRLPLRRGALLAHLTLHLAAGFGVVAGQQVAMAVLRSTVIPGEFSPVDPWGQLPLDLVRWGPAALGVYCVLVGVSAWMRAGSEAG